jgi:hypothetical protein
MKRSDLFMQAMYSAIADGAIPPITGFGNGVDRRGNDYIDSVVSEYPVLADYMDGSKCTADAFNRYICFKKDLNYSEWLEKKSVVPAANA